MENRENHFKVLWHDAQERECKVTHTTESNLSSILLWLIREEAILEHIFNVEDDVKGAL